MLATPLELRWPCEIQLKSTVQNETKILKFILLPACVIFCLYFSVLTTTPMHVCMCCAHTYVELFVCTFNLCNYCLSLYLTLPLNTIQPNSTISSYGRWSNRPTVHGPQYSTGTYTQLTNRQTNKCYCLVIWPIAVFTHRFLAFHVSHYFVPLNAYVHKHHLRTSMCVCVYVCE